MAIVVCKSYISRTSAGESLACIEVLANLLPELGAMLASNSVSGYRATILHSADDVANEPLLDEEDLVRATIFRFPVLWVFVNTTEANRSCPALADFEQKYSLYVIDEYDIADDLS